ncbi:MAG: anthranilate/aminodeoxychorismate synthase component II, partial [Candidatus Omnitrophota bacterium]
MILMIDNYDSFTYNLVQYLGVLRQEVKVLRNDKISVEEMKKISPARI